MRRAYRCDCDGVSHLEPEPLREDPILSHLATIEAVTGHRPPSCPWRAYYDPLVREVLSIAWAIEPPNLAAVLGPDPPGILVDAIGVYRSALLAVRAEDAKKPKPPRTGARPPNT